MNSKVFKNPKYIRWLLGILMVLMVITGITGCGNKKKQENETTIQVTSEASTSEFSSSPEETNSEDINSKEVASEESKSEDIASKETESELNSTEEIKSEDNNIEEITTEEAKSDESTSEEAIDENGSYTTKEDVALYIYTYNKLPENFITKKEAQKLGWSGGSLESYAPGKCIGGDKFGNREGVLPEYGTYHECDIDTLGKSKRGAKRIVYSDDGRIYYTEDHYESFELLYGEEK